MLTTTTTTTQWEQAWNGIPHEGIQIPPAYLDRDPQVPSGITATALWWAFWILLSILIA